MDDGVPFGGGTEEGALCGEVGGVGFVGVEAEGGGGIAVDLGIVYEEAVLGLGVDLLEDGLEDGGVWLCQVHFLREKEVVEVVVGWKGKEVLHDVLPMQFVGVG